VVSGPVQTVAVRESCAHELDSMAAAARAKGKPLLASVFTSVAEAFRAAPAETTDAEFREGMDEALAWIEAFTADVHEQPTA
jgi:hypothetical protein